MNLISSFFFNVRVSVFLQGAFVGFLSAIFILIVLLLINEKVAESYGKQIHLFIFIIIISGIINVVYNLKKE